MASDMLGRRFSEMSSDRDRVEESVTEARGYHTSDGYVQEVISTAPPRISATNGEVVQVVTRRKTITSLDPESPATVTASAGPKLSYSETVVSSLENENKNANDANTGINAGINTKDLNVLRSDDGNPLRRGRGGDMRGEAEGQAGTNLATHPSRTSSVSANLEGMNPNAEFPSFYKGSRAGSSSSFGGTSPTPKVPNSSRAAPRDYGDQPAYASQLDTTSPPSAAVGLGTPWRAADGMMNTPRQSASRASEPFSGELGRPQQYTYEYQYSGHTQQLSAASERRAQAQDGGATNGSSPSSTLRVASRPFGAGRFVSLGSPRPPEQNAHLLPASTLQTTSEPSTARRSVRIGESVDLRVIEPSRLSPIRPEPGYAPVRFVTRGELRKMRVPAVGHTHSSGAYAEDNTHYYYHTGNNNGGVQRNFVDPERPLGYGNGNNAYTWGASSNANINRYASPIASRSQGQHEAREHVLYKRGGATRWSRSSSPQQEQRDETQPRPNSAYVYARAAPVRGRGVEAERNADAYPRGYEEAYESEGEGVGVGGDEYDTISLASSAQAQYYKDRDRLRELRERRGFAGVREFLVPRDEAFDNRGSSFRRGEGGGAAGEHRPYHRPLHPHEYATVEPRRRSGSAAASDISYNRLGVLRDGDKERAIRSMGGSGNGTYRPTATSYTHLRDLQRVDLDVEDVAEYLAAMRQLPLELMAVKPSQASEAFLVATRGTYLIKYNKNSQPHERFFALRMVPDEVTGKTHPYLVWALHDKSAGFKARLHLSYLMQAVASVQSPNFQRMLTTVAGARSSMALVGPYVGASKCTVPTDFAMTFVFHSAHTYRTVDVVALDEQTFRCWMIVMSYFASINNNEGGQPVTADDVGTLAPDTPRSQSVATNNTLALESS